MAVLKRPKKRIWSDRLFVICLMAGGVVVAFPLFWMFLGSFRPLSALLQIPPIIFPRSLTLENYATAWERIPLMRSFLNSSIISIVQVTVVLLTSSFAGHIFSKYTFKGKNLMFLLIMVTLMVPFYAYVISLFLLISDLGWGNTYQGIFGPWLVDAFGIFLMRQFMHEIPRELIDASKIDGASEGKIYFQVVLPLCKPALGVLGIFIFMWSWNSFFWPLVVIRESAMYTLPVAIATFVSSWTRYPEVGAEFATASIMVVPLIVVYLLFHKSFTRSFALSGLK